jgi:hypothetical protein
LRRGAKVLAELVGYAPHSSALRRTSQASITLRFWRRR